MTTVATAEAGIAACRYVTTAQAAFDSCDGIIDPGNTPGATLAVAEVGGSSAAPFAQFEHSKASEADHQVVAGLGDPPL